MRSFFLSLLLIIPFLSFSQYGGSSVYNYLNLPSSARIAALGGTNISMYNNDVNFGYANPALYNPLMDGRFSVSHSLRTGGVQNGYVAYAKEIKKWNATMGGGILYDLYGRMPLTDETGAPSGSFAPSEYCIQTGIAHAESRLSYGASVKLLYSQLESYSSAGVAIDIGGAFNDTAHQFNVGVVIRNIGTQFKSYTSGNREELPFELQAGISKRLAHLPLRFSITAHNLDQGDIRYADPNAVEDVNIFSEDTTADTKEKKYIADKIFRHVIFGGEFYFGENFNVRAGYDYMMAKELSLTTKRGLTGFSLGVGLQIKRFQLDYAHQFYSVAGGSNMISITTDINRFF